MCEIKDEEGSGRETRVQLYSDPTSLWCCPSPLFVIASLIVGHGIAGSEREEILDRDKKRGPQDAMVATVLEYRRSLEVLPYLIWCFSKNVK